MKLFLNFAFLIVLGWPVMGQSVHEEQMKDMIQRGKQLIEAGQYEQANLLFRRILTLELAIPSDFCYYFATSLYHTRQYQNSKSFINKYYEIAGQGGPFASQVRELEKKVDAEFSTIKNCQLCNDSGYRLETCNHCNGEGKALRDCTTCKGRGNLVCDLCSGGGVVIRRNVFNVNEYHTCGKCEGTGVMACVTCKSQKKLLGFCQTCKGIGGIPSDGICDHLPDASSELE